MPPPKISALLCCNDVDEMKAKLEKITGFCWNSRYIPPPFWAEFFSIIVSEISST